MEEMEGTWSASSDIGFKVRSCLSLVYSLTHSFQDVGFSKEYEELRADNCLDEYTAQDSQNPENRDKNRYPNIVACKFSDGKTNQCPP